ncbi:hypothetical protein CIL05_06915 [Virgibacillus profundi]|uniref:Uncharacterized protein n=1 Tax=Virgibacillus profundi TaxID=2024555 RepID=A0A2A2IF59_9BACI|nr:hypothetical protein [Virgibacillus profundi]PAV30192.1 hypothetical protein CIL05_06915 [Virgibacillus profundi]PXY54364.1 hypothetical protein CIT14_07000 [Virgibacillus profundi]
MYEYNQKTHAERILKEGFQGKFLKSGMRVLAKYYRDVEDKERKDRRIALYDFCEKNIEGYNRVKYYQAINAALNHASNKKNKLVEIEKIVVTKEELNYIDKLKIDYKYRKIIFTLLVLDKLSMESYNIKTGKEPNSEHIFGNPLRKYNELVKSSQVTSTMMKKDGYSNINDVVRYFSSLGLVEVLNQGMIKLVFINEISESGNESLKIVDYENIGLYYDLHKGVKNVKECEECEVPIRVKSNSTKYCDKCKKEIERIKTAKRVRRYRNVTE